MPAVLVIEDDANVLDIVIEGLSDEGYRAVGVVGPEEAAAALVAEPFALVLTDAFRPAGLIEGDARWATLTAVREAARGVPIVIVTAHQLDDYADYRERGFAALLAKPFDIRELYEVVRATMAADGSPTGG